MKSTPPGFPAWYYRDRDWQPTTQEEYDRRQAEWDEARRRDPRPPRYGCGTEGFAR